MKKLYSKSNENIEIQLNDSHLFNYFAKFGMNAHLSELFSTTNCAAKESNCNGLLYIDD